MMDYPCSKFGDCSFNLFGNEAFNMFLHFIIILLLRQKFMTLWR